MGTGRARRAKTKLRLGDGRMRRILEAPPKPPPQRRRRLHRCIVPSGLLMVLVGWALLGCQCEEEQKKPPTPHIVKPVPTPPPAEGEPLMEDLTRRRRGQGVRYVPPTPDEDRAFAKWVRSVTQAALRERLPEASAPIGFAGMLLDQGRLWVVGEEPDHKRGAGALVLRPSAQRPVVIEAPHTFFDRKTLDISSHVFQVLGARALLINTLHRGTGVDADTRIEAVREGTSPTDVAHADKSFFDTAHRALIEAEPALVVLQIHGFSDKRVPGVDAVVSAARTRGPARPVAEALRALLGAERVRVYPDDIKMLGGTTNTQAAGCRGAKASFVHLELSASLRNRVTEDKVLAERFARALGEGLRRH